VRVTPEFLARHFARRGETLDLGLQLPEATHQRIDFALLARRLLLDPLEPGHQPLVALVLRINDPLLTLAQEPLKVCQLLDQVLNEANGWLRSLVIEFIELSACQRKC
jgi:hypothetical protein